MTERHECEWKLGGWGYLCRGCDERLSIEQAEAMLNEYETLKKATEALSAEMAQRAVNARGFVGGLLSALRAYADILSGKVSG